MSSGRSARDTSIRPQLALSAWHGGLDIAESEKDGTQKGCMLPRARQIHQRMDEVNGVDDAARAIQEEEITAPDEEEAEQIQCLPIPETPTLSDVLDHRCTHYPYRPWCPDCVEGRGREFGHSAAQLGEGRSIPTVSLTIVL